MLSWPMSLTAFASLKKRDDDVFLRRQLLEQHLDGDALADERVLAEVDGAHAAFAELGLDLVVSDALADQRHPYTRSYI